MCIWLAPIEEIPLYTLHEGWVTSNDGFDLGFAKFEIAVHSVFEFLLQIKEDVVISHIEFMLSPKKSNFLKISEYIRLDDVLIGRSLPTENDLIQLLEFCLVILAI
jgi:hypothetical protein